MVETRQLNGLVHRRERPSRCSALVIAAALTLKAVFRLTLQQAEELIGFIIALA